MTFLPPHFPITLLVMEMLGATPMSKALKPAGWIVVKGSEVRGITMQVTTHEKETKAIISMEAVVVGWIIVVKSHQLLFGIDESGAHDGFDAGFEMPVAPP